MGKLDQIMIQPRGSNSETFLSRKLIWGFRRYVRRFINRNFNAVRVANAASLGVDMTGPLICFVNHPGWWDPMTAVLITDEFFPNRRFHAPMDAAALENYPILGRLGFFPLDRATNTGLKEFLRHCRELLTDDVTAIWVTPTGRFTDVRDRAPFMNGLGHIAAVEQNIFLLPVAVEYAFWNERYPEVLIEFGSVLKSTDLPVVKSARTEYLQDCLARTQSSLSQKVIARNPDAFRTMTLGRSGIGGAYDFFRQIAAFFRGGRFQRRHQINPEIPAPSSGGSR